MHVFAQYLYSDDLENSKCIAGSVCRFVEWL